MEKEPKILRFFGIDDFNRPVFKRDGYRGYYGSINILFDYSASEEEVLSAVSEEDMLYFGNEFGCEPFGDPTGDIIIKRRME